MSLANAVLVPVPASPNSGQLAGLRPKYGGMKIVERRFDIKAGTKAWGDNIEDWVFDVYATKDGESTCDAEVRKPADGVRDNLPFANCYLEEQWVISGDRQDNDSQVIKQYFEAYETLREWEKPIITFDEDGRRIEDRTFIILKSAEESAWKGIPGESDSFVAGDMVLDTQSAEVGNAVVIVKRRYLQVTDSWTQVGGDRIKVGPNNLLQVFRDYVALPDTSNDPLRTGASPITVEATEVFLGDVEIQERAGHKKAIRKWMEPGFINRSEDLVGSQKAITITAWKTAPLPSDAGAGYVLARKQDADYLGFPTREYMFLKPSVLSRSTRFQNNNKIKRETVVAFHQTPTASFSPAVTIEDGEDNEDGIPTKRKVFVGGSGRISTVTETRNNGNLTLTTIRFIGTDDGTTPPGVPVSTQTTAEDGLVLYTQQYAEGAGEIRRDTNVILDGAVRYTTILSLGTKVAAPGEFEDGKREEDGYTIHTSRGVEILRNDLATETWVRNNGKLIFTKYARINSAPSGSGLQTAETISEREGFTLYEATYVDVTGEGEIGRRTEHRLNDAVTYTTVTTLNSSASAPGKEVDSSTDDREYYTVNTSTGVTINDSLIHTFTWEEMGGRLKYTKVRSIDSVGTGDGKNISEDVSPQRGFEIYTNVYLEVIEGEVGRDEDEILDGAVKYVTIRSLNNKIDAPKEFERSEQDREHYTLHTSRGVEILNPDLGRRTETVRNNIEITITRWIDGPGSAEGQMVQQSIDRRPGFSIYTNVFVEGTEGKLETIKRDGPVPGSTQTTTLSLNGEIPPGKLIEDSTIERDGYTLYRKTGVTGVDAGSILFSYTTPYEVEVPGLVTPTTVSVPRGSIATVHVKNRTTKIITANVEVTVEKGSPPDTEQPAFNMDGIACSVTFTQTRDVFAGWATATAGGVSVSTAIRDVQSSVKVQSYEGCALSSTESPLGEITGDSAEAVQSSNGDKTITKVIGEGTMQGEVSGIWKEGGIIQRKSRHLFTTIEGETFWEVMTIKT